MRLCRPLRVSKPLYLQGVCRVRDSSATAPEHSEWDTVLRALVYQTETLAADIGRLRRRTPATDQYGTELVRRIASHVENLDLILQPTAAALVQGGCTVTEALAEVDRRGVTRDRWLAA